jgi:CheY-like chemotaxis protein
MRILLIEDDTDDQMIMRFAIERVIPTYECTIANNGREAIGYVESDSPYDIVLIDLNMPLMNGFETLKIIKKIDQYKNVPVVIVSTSRSKYDIDRSKRLGATHYIIKPDTLPELVDELKYVLTSV